MGNPQEDGAIRFVKKWAATQKPPIRIRDHQNEGKGYDLDFVYGNRRIEKIEVKGTKYEYKIPDIDVRNFRNKRLIADFLMVVGNVLTEGHEVLYRIPRSAINPRSLELKGRYHVRRFANRKNMSKYRVTR